MKPARKIPCLVLLLLLAAGLNCAADETIAITGGTVLTVTKGTIENGVVLIRDGKIAEVGQNIEIPEGAKVIDASGKFVMPGIIDAHTHIALGDDINEATSPSTPHMLMAEMIVPDSYSIYLALAGGYAI